MKKLNKLIYRIWGIILSGVLIFGLTDINAQAVENETEIMIENDIPDDLVRYFEADDYEVTCFVDETGNEVWYLLNNLEGTRLNISELNAVVSESEQKEAEIDNLKTKIKTLQTVGVIIILALAGAFVWALVMWKREWNINNSWRKPSESSAKKKAGAKEKRTAKRDSADVDNYSNSGAIKFKGENDT